MKTRTSTIRTSLLSGIAGLAAMGAFSFAAQAQDATPAPTTATETMPSGDATPAVTHVAKHRVAHRAHRNAQGMPTNDSTPAEKAATDLLNAQQVVAATPATPALMPTPATMSVPATTDTVTPVASAPPSNPPTP
jgi:hypothetical protein